MTPSIHASWTDAILACACFLGVWTSAGRNPRRWMAASGFLLVGTAASVGTFRLGGVTELATLHDSLSAWAGLVGIRLLGAGVMASRVTNEVRERVQSRVAVLAVVLTGVVFLADAQVQEQLRTLVAGGAMVGATLASLRSKDWPGALGAVGVIVAGLVISGEGLWVGFPRYGWFHLAMAASMVAVGRVTRGD